MVIAVKNLDRKIVVAIGSKMDGLGVAPIHRTLIAFSAIVPFIVPLIEVFRAIFWVVFWLVAHTSKVVSVRPRWQSGERLGIGLALLRRVVCVRMERMTVPPHFIKTGGCCGRKLEVTNCDLKFADYHGVRPN